MHRVFVAYPYDFSEADYRGALRPVGAAHGVEFVYADEKITNLHILKKIQGLIEESEFAIFDITTWNANVALELGIAIRADLDYYIAFNPKVDQGDAPADLRGIDRLQYTDYSGLGEQVAKLLTQQYGGPLAERDAESKGGAGALNEQLDAVREEIPGIVAANPGLAIGGIASQLGIEVDWRRTSSGRSSGPRWKRRESREGPSTTSWAPRLPSPTYQRSTPSRRFWRTPVPDSVAL